MECPECGASILPDIDTDEGMDEEYIRVYEQEEENCGQPCEVVGFCTTLQHDPEYCVCLIHR